MTLDPTWLFLSMIPSGVGLVLFVYGKRQHRWPQLAGGLLFMIYPYFAPTVSSLIAIGGLIGAAVWVAVRGGW